MPTSLEEKLRTAAAAYPGFSILGTNPFRWFDIQIEQGTAFPCIAVQVITNEKTYALQWPVLTSWYRVQFTIWSTPDSAASNAVFEQLLGFLTTFNAVGIVGLNIYPNFVLNNRTVIEARLEPTVFKRIVDVRIFNNDSL